MSTVKLFIKGIQVACLAILCATSQASIQDNVVHIAGFNYQVVMKGTGSGFILRDGYVVTAYHVAAMGRQLRVKDSRGQWHDASLLMRGKPDWAVLSVPTLRGAGIPIDRDGVAQGESMVAYGRFSEGIRMSHGYVQDWMFQRAYQHCTTNVYPGFSGGPVVDRDGEVVGIVSMQTPGGSCLYVPIGSIR